MKVMKACCMVSRFILFRTLVVVVPVLVVVVVV